MPRSDAAYGAGSHRDQHELEGTVGAALSPPVICYPGQIFLHLDALPVFMKNGTVFLRPSEGWSSEGQS